MSGQSKAERENTRIRREAARLLIARGFHTPTSGCKTRILAEKACEYMGWTLEGEPMAYVQNFVVMVGNGAKERYVGTAAPASSINLMKQPPMRISRQMQQMSERCKCQPRQVAMVSNVPPSTLDTRR